MKHLLLFLFFSTLLTSPALCDNQNLKIVQKDIHQLKTRLIFLENRSRSLSEDVEYLSARLQVFLSERAAAVQAKKKTETELDVLKKNLKQVALEIQQKREYLSGRLKTLYRKEDYLLFETVMMPKNEAELTHSVNLFLFLAEKDRETLDRLSLLHREKTDMEGRLSEKTIFLERKIRELTTLHRKYRTTYREKRALYRKIRTQKKLYAELLTQRKVLLSDLMSTIATTVTTRSPSRVPMGRFKGLLSLPVKGKIIEKFGRVRNRKFGTWLKNNGITIHVIQGTPVHALYDGVVVYAGWYKSYGRLLILNHGDNYYSFYAHLDSFSVTINQVVTTGDIIARSGDTASLEHDVLHFELWHERTPLNPLKWVRKGK
ncbi:MAG: peptidoglycan DD-metalloendopeptidase family protein [Acidobacteria bacterium]|nr:peptidoglycan DD-metalloendopeptidase family protein [Acidobacteriota bacterium]